MLPPKAPTSPSLSCFFLLPHPGRLPPRRAWCFSPGHEDPSPCCGVTGAWCRRKAPGHASFQAGPAVVPQHATGEDAPHLPRPRPEREALGQNQPPSHAASGELRPACEQNQPAGQGWQASGDVAPGVDRREPAGPHTVSTAGRPPRWRTKESVPGGRASILLSLAHQDHKAPRPPRPPFHLVCCGLGSVDTVEGHPTPSPLPAAPPSTPHVRACPGSLGSSSESPSTTPPCVPRAMWVQDGCWPLSATGGLPCHSLGGSPRPCLDSSPLSGTLSRPRGWRSPWATHLPGTEQAWDCPGDRSGPEDRGPL